MITCIILAGSFWISSTDAAITNLGEDSMTMLIPVSELVVIRDDSLWIRDGHYYTFEKSTNMLEVLKTCPSNK